MTKIPKDKGLDFNIDSAFSQGFVCHIDLDSQRLDRTGFGLTWLDFHRSGFSEFWFSLVPGFIRFLTGIEFHRWTYFTWIPFTEAQCSHVLGFRVIWIHKDLDSQGLGFSHSSDSDFAWMRVCTVFFGFSQRFRFPSDSDGQGSPWVLRWTPGRGNGQS